MFESSDFEKLNKSADKFKRILKESETLANLSGLRSTLSSMRANTKEADKLKKKLDEIRRDTIDLAFKEAGITKQLYQRVTFFERQEAAIKRQITKLQQKQKIEDEGFKKTLAGLTSDTQRLKLETQREKVQEKIAKDIENQNRLLVVNEGLKKLEERNLKAQQKQNAITSLKQTLTSPFQSLAGLFTKFGLILGGLAIVFGAVVFAMKAIFGQFKDGLKSTVELGLDATQRFGEIGQAYRIQAAAARQFATVSIEEAIAAKGALTARLGTLDISDALVARSAILTRQIGLSADESAELLDFFVRIRKESAQVADWSLQTVKATAVINRANPAVILRAVAANSENFAKSAKASADELAKAAISANRMGLNLGTAAGIADRLVTDFEGALQSQATIASFAPGFNLSGLMVASQFGTDEDIIREVKSSIDSLGVSFDELPRSFKLAISSSLGVSVQELAKIAGARTDQLVTPGESAIIESNKNALNEAQRAIVSPLESIARILASLASFLVSKLSIFGGGGSQVKADIAASGFIPKVQTRAQGGIAGITPAPMKSLRGLSSNEVPTILHRGEAVLNQSQQALLAEINNARVSEPMPVTARQTTGVEQQNKVIEQKLDTIISLFRSGKIAVYLDGKKVSSALIESNRYG